MATTVAIQLTMDESGALTGIRSFNAGLQQTAAVGKEAENSVRSFVAQASAGTATLNAAGSAGKKAGKDVADGMDQAGAHTLTTLDSVRLLRDDLGIHIPRAMESLLSKLPGVGTAIQSAFGVLAALGIVELLGNIGSKVYEQVQDWAGLTTQVKEAEKAQIAYNNALLGAPKTSGQGFANLQALNAEISRLEKRQQDSAGLSGWANRYGLEGVSLALDGGKEAVGEGNPYTFTSKDKEELAALQTQREEDAKNTAALNSKFNQDELQQQEKITEAGVTGYAKIRAEIDAMKQDIDQHTKGIGDPTIANLDPSQAAEKKRLADQLGAAQAKQMSIQDQNEIARAQDAAREAGMQGDALWLAQKQDAHRQILAMYQQQGKGAQEASEAAAASDLKFDNERMLSLQKLEEETQKLQAEAQAAGLTGVARTQADRDIALSDVDKAERHAVGGGTESLQQTQYYAGERQRINAESDAKILEEKRSFVEQMKQLQDEADSAGLTGANAIYAQTGKRIENAQRDYDKQVSGLDIGQDGSRSAQQEQNYQTQQADFQAFQNALVAIQADGDRQIVQLNRDQELQVEEIEAQASSVVQRTHSEGLLGIIAEEQSATQKFEQEYQRRLDSLQKMLNASTISSENAAREAVAYHTEEMAQIENATVQARDRVSSELEGFFNDPAGTAKRAGEKLMFDILANWVIQLDVFKGQNGGLLSVILGGSLPAGSGGTQGGGIWQELKGLATGGSGSGGLAAAAPALQTAGVNLNTAGGTLTASGSVLNTSGVALVNAAGVLSAAAQQLFTSGASAGGGGSLFGLGGGGVTDGSSLSSAASLAQTPAGISNAQAALGLGLGTNSADYSDLSSPFGAGVSGSSLPSNYVPFDSSLELSSGEGTGAIAAQQGAASGSGALGALGGVIGAGAGGYAAFSAISNAYSNNDPVGGLLGGALGGLEAGAAIGTFFGPVGTLIGAGIGAFVGGIAGLFAGLFGESKHSKAKKYATGTVEPEIDAEVKKYYQGLVSYEQAYRDLNDLAKTEQSNMVQKFGASAGNDEFTAIVTPYLAQARGELDSSEGAGRDLIPVGAAQFHDGGWVGGFGSLRTSANEGFIHAMAGEFMMNPRASAVHAPVLEAMNNGASWDAIGNAYRSAVQPSSARSYGGGRAGGTVALTIQAIDTKGAANWLKQGGAQLINKHLNLLQGNYAGLADA